MDIYIYIFHLKKNQNYEIKGKKRSNFYRSEILRFLTEALPKFATKMRSEEERK